MGVPGQPESRHNSVPVWHSVPIANPSLRLPQAFVESPVWPHPLEWLSLLPTQTVSSWTCPADLGMELGIGKTGMAFQRALTLSRLVAARLALAPAASARWTLAPLGH